MFKRILVATRGEIAVRIIRACREMGIESVVVYSTADEHSLAVQLATKAVCIGSARASDSYLNQQAIMTVAIKTQCEAIHPGYGFLSENDEFSDLCSENNICFIGPSGDVIRKMGNKAMARKLMLENNVPVVPGSDGVVENVEQAKVVANKIGYPILIKASAGGGGRGMRRANDDTEIENAFSSAKAEAIACFDNGDVYIEKLILNPRHIEIQILADKKGSVIHLGERNCSIQRKNQKMIEESPAKGISEELRNKMGNDAVNAAKAVNYLGAGTIEYVVSQENDYYFIEMNTRVQVEHPVSEMVSGVDIIRAQIQIAAGLALEYKQDDIKLNGHAIECRINAEDCNNNFCGVPGTTQFLHLPGGCGVRVDSCLYTGYELSPFYDSMVAKIIVHAPTRLLAIKRMRRALEEMVIQGYPTNIEFLHVILHHTDFIKGNYNTGFIEKNMQELLEWCSVEGSKDE